VNESQVKYVIPVSFLPGIPPTGKKLEIAIAGVVALRGDKLYFEHLCDIICMIVCTQKLIFYSGTGIKHLFLSK
jgi:hypothetical protein